MHQAACTQGQRSKGNTATSHNQTLHLLEFLQHLSRATQSHRYVLLWDLYLAGAYHCIFYLCRPEPVSTDVNDIIHAPCYLVIAFLGPVSTIPSEIVTYQKDTGN